MFISPSFISDDYASALTAGGIGSGVDDIAGNTGAMADAMDTPSFIRVTVSFALLIFTESFGGATGNKHLFR